MVNAALIGALIAIYCIISLALPRIPLPVFMRTYLLQPVLWGLLCWLVRRLPPYRSAGKRNEMSTLLILAVFIGFVQVIAYLIGGLFSGFGKNPSSLTPLGILTNVIFVGAMLVGMEYSRAWLINRLGKRHTTLSLAFVALFYTALSIPLGQFTGFRLEVQSISQINSTWLPLLAENLLATLLARLAGAKVSLTYRGLLAAFWWLCPILPDLPWSLKGLVGAAIPIVGMLIANGFHTAEVNRGKSKREARQAAFPTGWIITAIFSIMLAWFVVGIFPFQPVVVPTGSMIPVLQPGDVVIVSKVQPSTIKIGDIMEYRNIKENINIVHRVIEINGSGDQQTFITKGDNNESPDTDPVMPQQVLGKVVFHIPRVGWISLVLKKLFTS